MIESAVSSSSLILRSSLFVLNFTNINGATITDIERGIARYGFPIAKQNTTEPRLPATDAKQINSNFSYLLVSINSFFVSLISLINLFSFFFPFAIRILLFNVYSCFANTSVISFFTSVMCILNSLNRP